MHDGTPVGSAGRRWRMLYCDPGLVATMLDGTALQFATAPPRVRDADLATRVLVLFAAAAARRDGFAAEVALGEVLGAAFGRHALDVREVRRPCGPVARVRARLDDAPSEPASSRRWLA